MKKILKTKQTHENGVYEHNIKFIKKINHNFSNPCFYNDGDTYEGEYYEDDKPEYVDGYAYGLDELGEPDRVIPHGKGTMTLRDKYLFSSRILSTFVGKFYDGYPHGKGKLTSGNVEKGYWEGEWKDGSFYDGNIFDKDGNITGKFVKGEEQNETDKILN
jgi:hypothetical protein